MSEAIQQKYCQNVQQNTLPAWVYVAVILACVLIGALFVTMLDRPLILLAAVMALPVVIAIFIKPEIGIVILVFVTFTRAFEVLLGEVAGEVSIYTIYLTLLVGILAVRWLFYGEKIQGWERSAILFGSFGILILASLLYAVNKAVVQRELLLYAKDILMLLLIIAMVRHAAELRLVIWALLSAGIFLGSISIYQQLTSSFDSSFWGFGQVKLANIVEGIEGSRIGGPSIDPNLYGQIMLVLVPLAWDRIWSEKKLFLRLLAAWALVACIASIVFSFSRGNFIGLVVVIGLLFVLRPPNPMMLASMIVTVLLFLPLIPPEYLQRLTTLSYIIPGVGEGNQENLDGIRSAQQDVSFRGRLSENIVGLLMTRDHPIIGVGYRNFQEHYQTYSRTLGLDSRREGRSAHNLYLEISAEQGIIGLFWFIALNWVVFGGILRARESFASLGMSGYVGIATAMGIGLIGLLFTSIFLHMVYPRYFWLFYAVALTIPNVANNELDRSYISSGYKQLENDPNPRADYT